MVRSFRELRVYQLAFSAQLEVYRLAREWPRWERFVLVAQILRSSRSVCTNIAEAWRKRRYPKAFVAKISDAEGEADETRVHLDIAVACGYLDSNEARRIDEQYDAILAGLNRMAENPRIWTPRTAPRPRSGKGERRSGRVRKQEDVPEGLPPVPGARKKSGDDRAGQEGHRP